MKWYEFNGVTENSELSLNLVLTNITCPKCEKCIYLDNSVVLTTYPTKYFYVCECGWYGFSRIKWQPKMKGENDE